MLDFYQNELIYANFARFLAKWAYFRHFAGFLAKWAYFCPFFSRFIAKSDFVPEGTKNNSL